MKIVGKAAEQLENVSEFGAAAKSESCVQTM